MITDIPLTNFKDRAAIMGENTMPTPAERPDVPKHIYQGQWYRCETNGCSRKWKTVMVREIVPPCCLRCGNTAAAQTCERGLA